ncbi:MAG: hypothetical protein ACXACD_20665 [Candidatus Thorarchaeota archaeon]
MYTRDFLLRVKRKALRKGVWFKVLDGLDRSFINLICTIKNNISSEVMVREVMAIVIKLRDAVKGEYWRLVESIGVQRAWRASENALQWGYKEASSWKYDTGFHIFHAVIEFSSPTGWGI